MKLKSVITRAIPGLLFFILFQSPLLAQEILCGNSDGFDQLIPPSVQERIYEANYQEYVNRQEHARSAGVVYTLPVVVHIVHDCRPLGSTFNPTNDGVLSSINDLNNNFQHASGETFDNPFSGVDTEIEFCLATTDPDGNYTTGIIRHTDPEVAKLSWGAEFQNAVLAKEWPTDKYLNIYVVGESNPPFTGLGSAYYNYVFVRSIGGSILAHEVGHYLSLAHIMWSDCVNDDCMSNGDRICDTPPAINSQPNCNQVVNSCLSDADDLSMNNPYRPIAGGGLGDQPDMAENYMHFRGNCWKAFSVGQSARMRYNIESSRMPQVNHAAIACQDRPLPGDDAGLTGVTILSDNCSSVFEAAATLKNYGLNNLDSVELIAEIDGQEVQRINWHGSLAQDLTEEVNFSFQLPAQITTQQIRFFTENPNAEEDGFTENDSICINISLNTGIPLPYQPSLPFLSFPDGWTADNLDLSTGWQPITRSLGSMGGVPCQENRIEFKGDTEGEVASLMLPPLDFRGYTSVEMNFDLAFIAWQLQSIPPNVRMFIDVSNDCGDSRTIVYDKSNLDLATNDPSVYANRFPMCEEFVTESVDLSAFAGQSNIQIRLNAVGGFVSSIYLENFIFDGVSAPCSITNIFGNPGICIDVTHYNAYISLYYENPPSGNIIVNGQTFPVEINLGDNGQQIVLESLLSDGNPVDVTAYFESNPVCSLVMENLFMAPPECYPECVITDITAGEYTLEGIGNTYSQLITVSWAGPLSDYGPLIINDGWTYEEVSSGTGTGFSYSSGSITIRLTGLPVDGQPVDITAAFADLPICSRTETALFTAPEGPPECLITNVSLVSLEGQPGTSSYTVQLAVAWEGLQILQNEDLIFNGVLVDSLLGQSVACTVLECQGSKFIVVPGLSADGLPLDMNLQFENRPGCTYEIEDFFVAPLYEICQESDIILPTVSNAPIQQHHALTRVSSNAVLDASVHDDIVFKAGNEIELTPSFTTQLGVVFEAHIEPCTEKTHGIK